MYTNNRLKQIQRENQESSEQCTVTYLVLYKLTYSSQLWPTRHFPVVRDGNKMLMVVDPHKIKYKKTDRVPKHSQQ